MTRYTYAQLEGLWINNGGPAPLAPVMAAIALAESGGNSTAHNTTPPDDSVGLWQINYFAGLRGPRTAAFGTPEQLLADPNRQARAAVAVYKGQGLRAWSTYSDGAYRKFLSGSVPPQTNGLPAGGSAQDVSSSGDSCLIRLPALVPLTTGPCLMSKAQGRRWIGAGLMLSGGSVMLTALVLLAAGVGLRPAKQAAQQLVGIVPAGVKGGLSRRPPAAGRSAAAGAAAPAAASQPPAAPPPGPPPAAPAAARPVSRRQPPGGNRVVSSGGGQPRRLRIVREGEAA